ncbi:UDP-forming cellulose synthase catalytic subunit [Sphingobium sp. PNB]|uniref:UDP-forming cellulose synthase catalytic subunit n=1 Tax=Sphingobium sp. PNB TaxID=863934 RepID=UPI001CA45CE2|nr:UDP-forming cellulose synthase catalytic subunit [Sphingobium sp. PNB]MCB4858124.1 UDP-forming cellulose synthase catalytic subunit [Sphingobium sp. PNB]
MSLPSQFAPQALLRLAAGLFVAAVVIVVVTVPLDLESQWIFALTTMAGVILFNRSPGKRSTIAIGILSLLVSTRYLFWRTTHTLDFDSLPAALLGTGLYLAELYAWVILVLGLLQTSWPLDRPVVEIEGEPDQWPVIDVYIPTYNESLAIVQNTVFAAMDIDYPRDRFHVYILDDGRRPEFRAFARQAGCGYLTRADNLHAKAGNLNAAMKKTDGELIAIFDCDHVPTRAFLQMTVGWFQKDARLALMQTPHHFYSPDPVQRNLGNVKELPGEGDLFYGAVQKGNDLWNATFFCGSCAVIRRSALEQTNGFAGETVTEDAHTALKLQRMGWNTAYIGIRLSAGLATERLVLHVGQRIRWARGMTQIMRIDNPLFGPGLNWHQRLCYLNAMLHFQFPLPRIVFLTSPLAYLIGGQNIIHASAALIFAYALPHLFISTMSSERIQGGDRRPFWGEIYETLLAFHLVKPTLFTLLNPRKGKFNVTDKGGLLDQTYFDGTTVRPHVITALLLVFGVIFGFVKLNFPLLFDAQWDTVLLNTAWASFSLLILIAAISVAREQRQVRENIRITAQMPVTLYFDDGYVVDGTTVDISLGGLAAELPDGFALQGRKVTDISLPMGDETLTIPVDTVRLDNGRAKLRFQPLDMVHARHLVRAVMGRADAWQSDKPLAPVAGLKSIRDIFSVGIDTIIDIWRLPRRRKKAMRAMAAAAAAGALATTSANAVPAVPASTPAAATPVPAAGGKPQRLLLKDLQVKNPIRLAGTRGEYGIPFGLRSNQVVTGASLTLAFNFSPSLLGDLSQIVVLLNGEVVNALPLRPSDGTTQTVTMPINPALFLPGDNSLNLRFIGHYTRDCEDPFHSSLWANVSNTRSVLNITTQSLPLKPDLARLPAPFFDRNDNVALKLPFVFAGKPTNGELEAAASTASWFGGMASYRGYSFKPSFGQIPAGNAVLFVTPGRRIPGINLPGGPAATVITNPVDSEGQLLVVSGSDEKQLKQAAAALAIGRGMLGGASASLDGVRLPSFPRYSAPRWLRTDRPVRLGEIVPRYALQGIGLPPGPLSAGFHVAPDLFFWPRQGAKLDLRYRYPSAPWLDKSRSRLDLSMNGQYLTTLPLTGEHWWDKWFGGGRPTAYTSRADVVLPRYDLFGQNSLVFDYNLLVQSKQRCEGMLPDNVRVSILPESSIDLSHAYHALHMPNLASFAGGGYPFTVRPDMAETVVLLPGDPTAAVVEAFLNVMGRFGDATGAPAIRASVTRSVDAARMAGKDILVIGPVQIAQSESLFSGAPVFYQDGRLRVTERTPVERAFDLFSPYERSDSGTVDGFFSGSDSFSGIVGFQSPFDTDRSVVALLASDPEALPALVNGLNDTRINAQVQGDLSVVDGEGMASFAVGDGYWVGSLPVWMKIAYWMSQRPFLIALGGLLVAFLISAPVYLLFKRQETKRLEAVK